MLKDFSTLESDVASHAEAVLQGRLSKSQQRLIRREQLKNCAPLSHTPSKKSITNKISGPKGTHIMKSKSFRRFGPAVAPSPASERKHSQQPLQKYRKNKTTNLDNLGSNLGQTLTPVNSTFRTSEDAGINHLSNDYSFCNNRAIDQTNNNGFDKDPNGKPVEPYSQEMSEMDGRCKNLSIVVGSHSEEPVKHVSPKKKNSIFQNVTSMLKNIR